MLHSLRLRAGGRIPPVFKRLYLNVRNLDAPKRALPDFLILGGMKCGTTSLFNYLCRHPRIIGSVPKELFYFCSHPERGERWYRRHFPRVSTLRRRGAVCGEATPTTLYSADAARRVAETAPEARLVVLLRNPADRALSHYRHQARAGREARPVEEAFGPEALDVWRSGGNPDPPGRRYFGWSDYAAALRPWLDTFTSSQMLVIKSEEFFEDTEPQVNRVCRFLGLEPLRLAAYPAHNRFGGDDRPDPEIRAELVRAFQGVERGLAELELDISWRPE